MVTAPPRRRGGGGGAALARAMDGSIPNFSLRMHEATAAMLTRQLLDVDDRRAAYNERYGAVAAALDCFGSSVPPSGDILAVGAYKADPGGLSEAGAAYLYKVEQNGSVTYLDKVTAPDGSEFAVVTPGVDIADIGMSCHAAFPE